ncbi:hypothetical protein V6N13_043521 [Hibiscus sabdariffa]
MELFGGISNNNMTQLNFDWNALFSGSEEQSLKFFPPEILEGSARVKPHAHVFEDGSADWKFALVGQFIGSAPNFGAMQRIVDMLWGKSSKVKHKTLILSKWEPNFNMLWMPIWIQLYRVPLELYLKLGLSYIASAIGIPLYMDSVTASRERLKVAKVYVEVGVGVKIPKQVWKMKKLLENSSVPYELSYVHELVEVFPDDLALKGVSEARGDLCPGSSVDIVDAVPVSDPVVYAVGVADAAVCAASCEDSVTDVVVCAVGAANTSVFGAEGVFCEVRDEVYDGDFHSLQASAQKKRGRVVESVLLVSS